MSTHADNCGHVFDMEKVEIMKTEHWRIEDFYLWHLGQLGINKQWKTPHLLSG